jgi:MFS family permease
MTAEPPIADRVRLRRRALWTLVTGVALGSTGHIAAATVATVAANDIAGTSASAGVPGAAMVMGAAVGATVLSAIMARRGRRAGVAAGYALGVAGAVVATLSIVTSSLALLLLGMLLIGFGNSSNQLSRYVAADMYPTHRRASAIGIVVWAATVGAVVGPNLVGPAGHLAEMIGLPPLAGAYLVPVAFVGIASLVSLLALPRDTEGLGDGYGQPVEAVLDASARDLLLRPRIASALLALLAGQVVMVLIMTMTPLHMTNHGHGLESVGLVISGHTFGMYALAPISGRLTDRFGSGPVIVTGLSTLAISSVLSAVAPPDGGAILFVALFLLGFGWNLGYVAGSSLLTHGLGFAERARLQGLADTIIWSSAAAASLTSGIVVAYASYTALGLLGAGLVVVPIWLFVSRRSTIAAAT